MAKYKLTAGTLSRVENGERKRYAEGDTVEMTAAQAKAYGLRNLAPVEEEAPAPPAVTGSEPPKNSPEKAGQAPAPAPAPAKQEAPSQPAPAKAEAPAAPAPEKK